MQYFLSPEMEFNGYEIFFADLPFQIGPIQENIQFVKDGLSARTQVGKVDIGLHLLTSVSGILRELRWGVNETPGGPTGVDF